MVRFVKEGGSRSHAEKTFEDVSRPSREYWTRPKAHREDQFVKAEERSKNYQNWAIESLARKPLKGYELTDPDSKFEKKIQERRDQIYQNSTPKFEKIEPKKKSIPKRRNVFSKAVDSAANALHAIGEHGRAMTDAIEDLTSIKEGDSDLTQVKKMAGKVLTAPNYIIGKALSYVDRPLRGVIEQKKYIATGIRAVAYAQGGPVAGLVTDVVLGHKPSEKDAQKLVKANIIAKYDKEADLYFHTQAIQHDRERIANGFQPMNAKERDEFHKTTLKEYARMYGNQIEEEFENKMKMVDKTSLAVQIINDAVQSQKDAETQKKEGTYQPQSKMGQQVYASGGGGGGAAQFNAGFFAGFAHGKRWRSRSNFRYKKWFSMHYDRGYGGGRYAYRGKRSRFVNRYGLRGYKKRPFEYSLRSITNPWIGDPHIFWSVK